MDVNQKNVGTCNDAIGIKLKLVTGDCTKSGLGSGVFKEPIA